MRLHSLALTAVLGAFLAGFAPVSAQADILDGPSLRKLVTGRTVFLAAPLGGEFPLNYRPDGTVTGDGDAIGLGKFFAAKETGRWSITGNTLCQRFPTWYKGEPLCFTVRDLGGNKIRWVRDNGEQGIARVSDSR